MNVSEGMRRVALLAGALGAIAGVVVSFIVGSEVTQQRGRYLKFQELLAKPAVQTEIRFLKNADKGNIIPGSMSAHNGQDLFDFVGATAGAKEGWKVNADGVSTIYFRAGEVNCIADENQMRFCSTALPSLTQYLTTLLWPVMGFLLPWGSTRSIMWVVRGFYR